MLLSYQLNLFRFVIADQAIASARALFRVLSTNLDLQPLTALGNKQKSMFLPSCPPDQAATTNSARSFQALWL